MLFLLWIKAARTSNVAFPQHSVSGSSLMVGFELAKMVLLFIRRHRIVQARPSALVIIDLRKRILLMLLSLAFMGRQVMLMCFCK